VGLVEFLDKYNIASFSPLSIGKTTFFAIFSLIPQLSPHFGLFSPRFALCCADRIAVFRLVWIAAANCACYHIFSGGRSVLSKYLFRFGIFPAGMFAILSFSRLVGRIAGTVINRTFPAFAVGRIGSGFPHSQTEHSGGGMNRRIGSAGRVGSRRLVSTLFRHKPRYFDFSE